MLIVKSAVKELVGDQKRVSKGFLMALDKAVYTIINRAVKESDRTGKKTLMAEDLTIVV